MQKVVANMLTKEMKWNHKKIPDQSKTIGEKERKWNKENMGQIENK